MAVRHQRGPSCTRQVTRSRRRRTNKSSDRSCCFCTALVASSAKRSSSMTFFSSSRRCVRPCRHSSRMSRPRPASAEGALGEDPGARQPKREVRTESSASTPPGACVSLRTAAAAFSPAKVLQASKTSLRWLWTATFCFARFPGVIRMRTCRMLSTSPAANAWQSTFHPRLSQAVGDARLSSNRLTTDVQSLDTACMSAVTFGRQ
mmetsp:Transcript_77034/g.214249  ORF Transcript_77034/g.214249 Transcript_77034/m.214249 type:complete len:205 (-) Transcript_77034:414-1028(-)